LNKVVVDSYIQTRFLLFTIDCSGDIVMLVLDTKWNLAYFTSTKETTCYRGIIESKFSNYNIVWSLSQAHDKHDHWACIILQVAQDLQRYRAMFPTNFDQATSWFFQIFKTKCDESNVMWYKANHLQCFRERTRYPAQFHFKSSIF